MKALNVVIGHKPASLFYATRTSFFVGDEAASSLNMTGVKKESVEVAPNFVELWRASTSPAFALFVRAHTH